MLQSRLLPSLVARRFAPPFTRLNQHSSTGQAITPTALSGFSFIASNPLPPKPRVQVGRGVTEIRGPYYNAAFGPTVLQDTLALAGDWVDGLKFSGGAFTLMPEKSVRAMIDVAHKHGVYVSTGGFVEHVLATSNDRVRDVQRYVKRCKDLGFDVVELSTGFLSMPITDWAEMVQDVQQLGVKAKPELGIQWGAGGDASVADLESAGTSDVGGLVANAKVLLDAGAEILMIESEGITENVRSWRTDVISTIIRELPATKVMFEAADPKVFEWYIQNYGTDVNLFVDHSQAVQLACLRAGIWGTNRTFGRVVNYRGWSNKVQGK